MIFRLRKKPFSPIFATLHHTIILCIGLTCQVNCHYNNKGLNSKVLSAHVFLSLETSKVDYFAHWSFTQHTLVPQPTSCLQIHDSVV